MEYTSYEYVTNEIMNKRRFGNKCGRETIEEALPILGYPDSGMRIIHIAGTNGKGSTAACLESLLAAAGYRTGLFTSPHLEDFAERIRINGVNISHEDVVRIGESLLERDDINGTMFDYCLLMALIYYREQDCDYVILETGLGGRLDSTRGISEKPLATIITRIGYDHMDILGSSLGEIAAEKAGIIREGVPVVIGQSDEEALSVLKAEASDREAPVYMASDLRPELEALLDKIRGEGLSPGLYGSYQLENMSNALACIRILLPDISDETLVRGLKNASWPGRMEILRTDPPVIIDGAHNPQGVAAMVEALRYAEIADKGDVTFVIGMLKDKDYRTMIATMIPIAGAFYTVSIDEERGLDAGQLSEAVKEMTGEAGRSELPVRDITIDEAADLAANDQHPLVICGSLHFIGSVRTLLKAFI